MSAQARGRSRSGSVAGSGAPFAEHQSGGNLNIQRLQDTSSYSAKQQSAGAGVSLSLPPLCYGASSVNGSVSNAKVQGDFARVGEQSGIKAGDGGFQLQVKGGTDLKGGVIGSTQAGSGNASSTSSAGTVTDTVATCFEVGVDTVTRPYSMGERLVLAGRLKEGQGLCTTGAAAGCSLEPGRSTVRMTVSRWKRYLFPVLFPREPGQVDNRVGVI